MAKELITSTGNPRVKEALRLRRRRGRGEQGAILIDGVREIDRAIKAGVAVEELFVCPFALDGDAATRVMDAARKNGATIVEVNEPVFAALRYGDRTGGLVAVARRPSIRLDDLKLSASPLLAVVERTEKPGNLGAILRSADGAGLDAVIAVDPVTDVYGPNVIRASIGTVFSVPLVEMSAADARSWLTARSIRIVAAAPQAKSTYTEIDFRGSIAMILGGEAEGLTSVWNDSAMVRASVPMLGRADSLNVATTAALFFYEARRQRGRRK